jgi:hypothetical protein
MAACGQKLGAMGSAIASDPGRFFGSLVDAEDFSHGRIARGIGHLLPSIALALATAGTGGALTKGGEVTAAAEAGGGELAPAVIGRGMGARVIPYAEENGYVIYEGAPKGMTEAGRLAHNGAQIERWMREGRQIIDIGPGDFATPSANYDLEHQLIFRNKYPNYVQHWIDEPTDAAIARMR